MEEQKKNFALRIMIAITDSATEKKFSALLDRFHFPIRYQLRGQGTARAEWLDICGLSGTSRIVTICIVPKLLVAPLFKEIEREMRIKERGTGIVATIPTTGLQGRIMKLLDEEYRKELEEKLEGDEQKMKEGAEYSMILAAVNQGYSEVVMESARTAGATGGTVLRCSRRGLEEPLKFMGVAIQEEQEIVVIITNREKKKKIMTAISNEWGITSPAHGVILSLPIDEISGLA